MHCLEGQISEDRTHYLNLPCPATKFHQALCLVIPRAHAASIPCPIEFSSRSAFFLMRKIISGFIAFTVLTCMFTNYAIVLIYPLDQVVAELILSNCRILLLMQGLFSFIVSNLIVMLHFSSLSIYRAIAVASKISMRAIYSLLIFLEEIEN